MLDTFLKLGQTPYQSSTLPSLFVVGAPLILFDAKTKSHQSQRPERTLLEVLHSCLICRYRWKGWYARLKSSNEPRHILCQLGSGLDSNNGVEAMFL